MATKKKAEVFDAAEFITEPADQADLIAEAFESEDVGFIANALGIVARARGMAETARVTGLERRGLYSSLNADGDPRLSTVIKLLKAYGITLTVKRPGVAITEAAVSEFVEKPGLSTEEHLSNMLTWMRAADEGEVIPAPEETRRKGRAVARDPKTGAWHVQPLSSGNKKLHGRVLICGPHHLSKPVTMRQDGALVLEDVIIQDTSRGKSEMLLYLYGDKTEASPTKKANWS